MPVITTAMIGGIVTYIGTQLAENESIKGFVNELSEETRNWISPLFFKDDETLQKELENLKAKPDSIARQSAVKSVLEIGLEDNEATEKYIKEIFEKIEAKGGSQMSATKMKAKEGINFKAKQIDSKATFDDFETEGKIIIDLIQE
jgi:hypothetical protein